MCLNEITSTHQTWKDFQDILSSGKKKAVDGVSRKQMYLYLSSTCVNRCVDMCPHTFLFIHRNMTVKTCHSGSFYELGLGNQELSFHF